MKPKNLVILAAVVVLVGAYIFFFERHQMTSDEARKDADKVLRGFDQDSVTSMVIDSNSGRVRLEKVGEEWRLREPLDFPANGATVDSTLNSLAGLEADRRFPAEDADLSEYGLDAPVANLVLGQTGGGETTVAVGTEMPLGSKRALRVDGSEEIIISSGWFVSDLEREIDDWRSRDVVTLTSEEIASIDIGAGADSIRAVRLGDSWQLLKPVKDLGDDDHLQGLISDLSSLKIEEFLDDGADLAKLGLEAPTYEITVIRSDGSEPFRLDLGATREGEGGTEVACRRGDGEYFWVQDRVGTRLSKAPVLWRSKKVFPFSSWDAGKIRLSSGTETVELEEVDYQWRFTSDQAEAVQSRVQDRLTALVDLEATDYDLMAPLTGESGRAEVVLLAADDAAAEQTLIFTFYAPLAEGGKAVVTVSGRDNVMGIDPASVEAILGDLGDLRPAPEDEAANLSE